MTPSVPPATAAAVYAAEPGAIAWPDDARAAAFQTWLNAVAPRHGLVSGSLRAASADASFRRYFRVDGASPAASFIVMDAPPPQEDVRPFVDVAARVAAAGLPAPRVLEADAERGFLLLTDLGSRLMLGELQAAVHDGATATVNTLMRDAVAMLVAWQTRVSPAGLPRYDDALLRRELALFPEWCVQREFGVSWGEAEQSQWAYACDLLVANALAQRTVAVHRDYMPRNLMLLAGAGPLSTPGLLDFQDAVQGPITYDVASLLRDAFISWDEEQELDWAVRYWQQARKAGLLADSDVADDFGEFWRQVEWMGLQRHLKVLGIFCRLKHRDGKPAYSADLPRFFAYAHKVATRYQGFGPLARLLEPLMGASRVDAFY